MTTEPTRLPDEITVDDLYAMTDVELADLSRSRSAMTDDQRASFERAVNDLSRQFARSLSRSSLSPTVQLEIAQLIGDDDSPQALRDTLARLSRQYDEQQRELVARLRETDLPHHDQELAAAMAMVASPAVRPESFGSASGAETATVEPGTAPIPTPAPPPATQPPPTRRTAGQIRAGLEELEREKSALSELLVLHRKKYESDHRLEALFWIVSTAAVVQGVSTIVSADSWAQRWTTIAISTLLVVVALGFWRWRAKGS